ncbi:uncharacterized protein LY89DRAFT_743351 [Mollisia scopiformis]|uniref:Uncharacterized protein n=1 Tax=Mollisia scopiformis TaxID=149040 RepID=A0A132B561_MOLSC|nr:uncharacterized protein LY89DRAFT_743351 [Mollisia scopiformis]KUJ07024.1 hypothetical protein LY89DRAFT_743351 [Mollisia scopiformis]
MLFSRLPLSLLTLIFAFAFNANADDTNNKKDGDDTSGVEYVDIFAVDYPIVAYVVDSGRHDTAATTYHIACSSDADSASCPFAQPYTLIQGPSTLSFEFTAPTATFTQSFTLGCNLDSTTSMACSATGLAEADSPVTTSQTFSFTGAAAQAFFKEVQVVAKTEDLLTYTPGASSSSAKATITGSSEGGVFFEGKQEAATTSATVVGGIVVAEAASASATTTKSSGGIQVRGLGGVVYAGLVVLGVLGLGLL